MRRTRAIKFSIFYVVAIVRLFTAKIVPTNDEATLSHVIEDRWFSNQLKFRFGDWYPQIHKGILGKFTLKKLAPTPIQCSMYEENVKESKGFRLSYSVTISDIRKRNTFYRDRDFLELVRKLCPNITSSTYFKTFFYDDIISSPNQFILSHSRPYNSRSVVLVPFDGGHNPINYLKYNLSESFRDKKNILVWRGGTTGPIAKNSGRVGKNNRLDIVRRYYNSSTQIDIGFTDIYDAQWTTLVGKFTRPRMTMSTILNHKYVLCMEGNDWATNFIWVLASKSVPFHTYPFTCESIFWADGLHPWEHFVPVAIDGHDVGAKLNWCFENERACQEIGENGFKYMIRHLNMSTYERILREMVNMIANQKDETIKNQLRP